MLEQRDQTGKNDAGPVVGRRRALQLLSTIGIAGGLAGSSGCHSEHEAARDSARAIPRTLSEADFRLLSRLTELIIPKTDTAGAIEAGVPDFIDAALIGMPGAQLAELSGSSEVFVDNLPVLFADGLHWIDEKSKAIYGKAFLEIPETQQFTLLESAYATAEAVHTGSRSAQFLRALKALTVEGYYTSEEGLLKELGYRGSAPHDAPRGECKSSTA